MTCEQSFFDLLRERNFRLTPQREMVLSAMHQLKGFSTVEEIFACVQERSSAVDISTVYRTLELMVEFKLVAYVDGGEGGRRYELVADHAPHIHLVCRSCGRVLGADLVAAESLIAFLEESHSFQVDTKGLSIPGLCEACRVAGN